MQFLFDVSMAFWGAVTKLTQSANIVFPIYQQILFDQQGNKLPDRKGSEAEC